MLQHCETDKKINKSKIARMLRVNRMPTLTCHIKTKLEDNNNKGASKFKNDQGKTKSILGGDPTIITADQEISSMIAHTHRRTNDIFWIRGYRR